MRTMPRGKRTVFAVFCSDCNGRVSTMRFHKQDKMGVGWKEHVAGMEKYCPDCRGHKALKFKEEKHSS